jgi:hypothetical protein
VRVDPSREEEVRKMLENMIVPKARTQKGIKAGYRLRSLDGNILRAVQLYDTKANAQETAGQIQSEGPPPGAPVSLVSVNAYEVIAQL